MKGSNVWVKRSLVVGVFLAILFVGIVALNVRRRILDAQSVLGEMDITQIPYITSVAPLSVYVGEEYVYNIKYSDNDSNLDQIKVSLTEAPAWLHIDGFRVYGTPDVMDEGQAKFILKISDGTNSSVQQNYVLVQQNENK